MRSKAVMERIGMHRDPKDDFDHPKLSKEQMSGGKVYAKLEYRGKTMQATEYPRLAGLTSVTCTSYQLLQNQLVQAFAGNTLGN